MLHSFSCKAERTQFCLACGAVICACHGLARGTCPVCYRGLLSNYYKPRACGYKGCKEYAVAETPRVGVACLKHAKERGGYRGADPARVDEYTQVGTPTEYTQYLPRRIADWAARHNSGV